MAMQVKGHVALPLLRRALRTALFFHDVFYFIAAFDHPKAVSSLCWAKHGRRTMYYALR